MAKRAEDVNEDIGQCPAAKKLESIVAIGEMLQSFRRAFPASQADRARRKAAKDAKRPGG